MEALASITAEIDQLTVNDLTRIFDNRTFLKGRALANDRGVSTPRANHNQLSAKVYDKAGYIYRVNVTVSSDGIQTRCSCQRDIPCAHAAALLILWVQQRQTFLFTPLDKRSRPLPSPTAYSIWQGQPNEEHTASLLLAAQKLPDLRKIARTLGLSDTGQAKENLIWEMAPMLGQAEKIGPLLASCDQHEEAVLQVLALFDGDLGPAEITAVLEKLGGTKLQVANTLKSLQSRGLALSRKPSLPNAPFWSVPSEILPHLPKGNLALAQAWQGADDPTPPPYDLLVVLRAFCFLVEKEDLPAQPPRGQSLSGVHYRLLVDWVEDDEEAPYLNQPDATGSYDFVAVEEAPLVLKSEQLEQIAERLQAPPSLLAMIVRLLKQLYLIEVVDGKLRLRDRMQQFWQRSEDDQLRLLLSTWANDQRWSELHGVVEIQMRHTMRSFFSNTVAGFYTEWALLRRAIVRLVRHLVPEQTYDLADLYQRLQGIVPKLGKHLIGNRSEEGWRLVDVQKQPLKLDGPSSWQTVFLPYLREVLTYLSYFGVVQITHQGASIKLTARGARLLELQPSAISSYVKPELSIDSDLRIKLPIQQAHSALLAQLEQFSDLVEFSQAHFYYQISPRSMRDALAAGLDARAIITLLETPSKPLSKQIVTTLHDWSRSLGQSQFYPNLAVLELADELLVSELLRQTRLASAMLYQISPRLLLLDPAQLPALWEELVLKGYTPQRARLLNSFNES